MKNIKLQKEIFDNLNDAFIVTDKDHSVTYINSSAERLTGWQLNEAMGNQIENIFKIIPDQNGTTDEEPVKINILSGYNESLQLISKSGKTVEIENYLSNLHDEDGSANGKLIIFNDISDKKWSESLLYKLFKIVDENPSAIMITDSSGKIEFINPKFSELTGYSISDLIGKTSDIFKTSGNNLPFIKHLNETIKSGKEWKGTLKSSKKDGTAYWDSTSITSIKNQNNKITNYIIIKEDITAIKKSDEALKNLINRDELLIESIGDGIISVNKNGEVTFANQSAEKITGFSSMELIGNNLFDTLKPKVDTSSNEQKKITSSNWDLHKSIELNKFIECEKLICNNKQGEEYIIEYKITPLNYNNKTTGAVIIFQDISSRWNAQEQQNRLYDKLRKSEIRFHILLNSASQGIILLKQDGEIQFLNKKAEEYFQYTKLDIIGNNIKELFPENTNFLDIINNFKKDKSSDEKRYYGLKKDKQKFPIEMNFSLIDEKSDDIIICFIKDITKRIDAEHKLTISKERYKTIFNNSGNAITIINKDGKILLSNSEYENLTGYKKRSIDGKKFWSDFIIDDLKNEIISFFNSWAAQQENTFGPMEYSLISKDGSIKNILLKGSSFDKKGEIILSHTDISIIKAAESKISFADRMTKSSDKARQQFLANISHELRTPLNGIIGSLSLLNETELTSEQKEHIDTTIKTSKSFTNIINNIITSSEIESNKLKFFNESFNLYEELNKLGDIFSEKVNEKNLTLNLHYSNECPHFILGDRQYIKQILINIVGNAIKFTNKGKVNISVTFLNDSIHHSIFTFKISDTGKGIDKDRLKNIFNYFTGQNNDYVSEYGGIGLGLSISRDLVLLMEGTITIKSKKDKGTEIIISLPIKVDEKKETIKNFAFSNSSINIIEEADKTIEIKDNIETAEEQNSISTDKEKFKILLVEDDPISQRILAKMITRLGYKNDIASNGEIALEMIAKKHYNLIFMDIQMPVMNGYETTMNIRKMDNPISNIPIIAVSAFSQPQDKERAFLSGINDYITKPILKNVISKKIDECFNSFCRSSDNIISIMVDIEKGTQDQTKDYYFKLINNFIIFFQLKLDEFNYSILNKESKAIENFANNLNEASKDLHLSAINEISNEIIILLAEARYDKFPDISIKLANNLNYLQFYITDTL